ncbi:ferrous iron transport protein B [Anaeromicropila herbilytica]|uniref:Ferrous iron transport protein B n=1 Tax=Anaeromicropila herbilytica TaxID=2785025 RepID=A0A7R7ENK9_9FIRM|nr:ferrous iron transport protein B [Anaeromicropila herbilytica]BCN32245.1 ferrous iron transport protein B [Anaeromicropila herbilytica]
MKNELQVGFIGNPNCGKTTLFNAYTGAKLKVANWPGVTVEKKEGAMKYHEHKFRLVDLPGIYSLTSYTMEEKLTRQYILENDVDVIIDIADASCLERNLYLTLQLIELGKPVVLALNMMDIVAERGMEIDLHRLPEMLGIPVIPVSARKKTGLDILMHAVAHHKTNELDVNISHHHNNKENMSHHVHNHHREYVVVYSDEIEDKIDAVSELLSEKYGEIWNLRWHAIKLLEQDEEIVNKYPLDISHIADRSYETDIINQKYDLIEEIIEEVVVNKSKKAHATDAVDKLLTNRYLGLPMFLGIMAIVFFLTFTVGDLLKGVFEYGIGWFSDTVLHLLKNIGASPIVISLIVDGIIAGVGGILTFLPNIFILFLALAILEDSGYMARVAYVMDSIMSKVGLSGRAFIPMLLGFGCSVPAVMASRALEDKKDRFKTILITPFMSCSARLPIYVLFSQMFFKEHAMLAAYSMYIIGLVTAIIIALVMNVSSKKSEMHTLLIELPEYKSPNARTIGIYVLDKVKDYLTKAGTTIFIASIGIWVIMNFGVHGLTKDISDSFAAGLGKLLVPVLAPAGLGLWQIGVALISGLAAKEIVVSSFSVLFGITNINSNAGMDNLVSILSHSGFTSLNAYSLMVFCLLYTPCIATIATIKRELQSRKWTAFVVFFQLVTAWVVATLVYQIGSIFL